MESTGVARNHPFIFLSILPVIIKNSNLWKAKKKKKLTGGYVTIGNNSIQVARKNIYERENFKIVVVSLIDAQHSLDIMMMISLYIF